MSNYVGRVEIRKAQKQLFVGHPVEQIAEHLLKRHRAETKSDGEERYDERVVVVEYVFGDHEHRRMCWRDDESDERDVQPEEELVGRVGQAGYEQETSEKRVDR